MKRNYLTLGLISLALAACGGGENGLDGKDGKDGGSCTITNNEDGSATITCPDGTSFTVKNGENGHKGDAGSDGEKGQNGQSCKLVENSDGSAAVVCPYDGTSYIVRGNTDNYANYCAPGFYGKNCENECSCNEHQDCNDGITGDGSCSCIDAWTGEDCGTCPTGFYNIGDNCYDCRKGISGSAFDKEKCNYSDTRTTPSIEYPVVTIGDQLWMAKNMAYQADDITCLANTKKDPDFVKNYGCLYVWDELATVDGTTDSQNVNRICPDGWHVPTIDDFDKLLKYVGNDNSSRFMALIAKSAWEDFSNQGGDDFGFGALPAGYYYSGDYGNFGYYGLFWSSTELNGSYAYNLLLGDGDAGVLFFYKTGGNSVRCLRDEG